jgi:metal-dependent amidase/aminoacylase/carboxypeptidase family protein
MSDKESLKAQVLAEIDRRSDEIVAISDHVMRNPETGYREVKTAAFVADHFKRLGLTYREGVALTGVKARMPGAKPGPTVALMGELDSLVSVNHPYADPVTGAAHCCGHNAMIGSMLGAAFGLRTVMEQLAGDVVLFAVPAEEGIELEYRMELREEGKIEFRGRAAHAGGWPWEGVNALKAATLAMTGMDFQRETFRDDDNVRIHWNLTKGGEAVSAVPDDVRLDMMVRANRVEAMLDASAKVDRALRAGALALGAEVEITTMSGVLPMRIDPNLRELVRRNQESFLGADQVGPPGHSTAGTDVGDLGHIMPVCQPLATGVTSVAAHRVLPRHRPRQGRRQPGDVHGDDRGRPAVRRRRGGPPRHRRGRAKQDHQGGVSGPAARPGQP